MIRKIKQHGLEYVCGYKHGYYWWVISKEDWEDETEIQEALFVLEVGISNL